MPLISVIIPTYNRAEKLKAAVQSVLDQTETDLEVWVIDDGSDDHTKAVIRAVSDPRLKYVHQENLGACAARNRGVSLAGGEYIAFQDSDDLWRPDKLRLQMRCIKETDADVVYGRLARSCPDGTVNLYPSRTPSGFLRPQDSPFGIGAQTLLAKRAVFDKCLFDPSMPRFQELEWLCRVRKAFSVYGLTETVADYRPGADSISESTDALLKAGGLLFQKHPDLTKTSPAARQALEDCLLTEAERCFRKGDSRYLACLSLADRAAPSGKTKALFWLGRLGGYPFCLRLRNVVNRQKLKRFPPFSWLKSAKHTFEAIRQAEAVRCMKEKGRIFGRRLALSLAFSQTADILTGYRTHFYHHTVRRFCDGLFAAAVRAENAAPETADKAPSPLSVWTLWWDGEESAPACVRLCLESQRRHFPAPDYAFRILTKDDYSRYVSLPQSVLRRYEQGQMTLTHLSDVLRCELLNRYGGLWIDATVYMTGPLDRRDLKKPFYTNRKTAYPENLRRLIPAGRWACYLMGCRAGDPLMRFLTEGYRLYWEKFSGVLDYYLLDDMIDAAWRLIPAFRSRMEQVPLNNQRIFDLYSMRNEAYRPERMETLLRENCVHKLSYKDEYRDISEDGKKTVWAWMREEAGHEI